MNTDMKKKYGKVAVLMGGDSSERDVSLWSGEQVLNALLRQGVEAYPIDTKEYTTQQLIDGQFDRAFIILHGRGGEDGRINGALEYLGIPYTGSGVESSALAMNKIVSKWIWEKHGLPTLPFAIVDDKTDFGKIKEQFELPICMKPAHEGSSQGVVKVNHYDDLFKAYEEDLKFEDQIIIEHWIEGREFTVGILGEQVLPIIEMEVSNGFYDYNAKYLSNETVFICPVDLPQDQQKKIQSIALQGFKLLGCSGWGRMDFLQDKHGNVYLTEANTVPGMTAHSLIPLAAKQMGMTYDEVVLRILDTSF